MKDAYSAIGVVATLAAADFAATTKGSAVDLQGFNSATLIINTGAITAAGKYDVRLQESSTTTDADFTDVPAKALLGVLPADLAASTVYKQGYRGTKRYVRAVITKQSGTSVFASATIVRGHAADAPVA